MLVLIAQLLDRFIMLIVINVILYVQQVITQILQIIIAINAIVVAINVRDQQVINVQVVIRRHNIEY